MISSWHFRHVSRFSYRSLECFLVLSSFSFLVGLLPFGDALLFKQFIGVLHGTKSWLSHSLLAALFASRSASSFPIIFECSGIHISLCYFFSWNWFVLVVVPEGLVRFLGCRSCYLFGVLLDQGWRRRGPRATFGPRRCFVWPAQHSSETSSFEVFLGFSHSVIFVW